MAATVVRINNLFVTILLVGMTWVQVNGQISWEQIQLPQGGHDAISIVYSKSNPDVIYSLTDDNIVTKTQDGGISWIVLPDPPGGIWDVIELILDPTDSDILYLVNSSTDYTHRSSDGGNSWSAITTPGYPGHGFQNFSIDQRGYLYGYDGQYPNYSNDLYKSTDLGATWTIIYSAATDDYITKLTPSQIPLTLFAYNQTDIVKSLDGGNTWEVIYNDYPGSKIVIDPIDTDIVYILGYGSNPVLRTLDGFSTVDFIDAFDLELISNDGILYKREEEDIYISNNNGSSWNLLNINYSAIKLGTFDINPSDTQEFISSCQGSSGIYISSDGGSHWSILAGIENPVLEHVIPLSSSNELVISLTNVGTLKAESEFGSWELIHPETFSSTQISPINNDHILLYDYYEGLFISTDGGEHWIENTIPFSESTLRVNISLNDPNILYAWKSGQYQIYNSHNMGESWTTLSLPEGNLEFLSLIPNDPSVVFINDNYTIYKSNDYGTSWEAVLFPDNISGTVYGPFIPYTANDTQYYYAYDNGTKVLLKSTDNSSNFISQSCCTDTYFPDEIIFHNSSENLFLGEYSSSAWISTDEGLSWGELNHPLGAGNGFEMLAFSPFDDESVIAYTDEGLFYGAISEYIAIDDLVGLPIEFTLQPNYPNPFNPVTTISYSLPEASLVKLTVFDIRGQEVMTLQDATKPPGNYEIQWGGLDQAGNQVSTGVYFARLQAGDISKTIKMVYLR